MEPGHLFSLVAVLLVSGLAYGIQAPNEAQRPGYDLQGDAISNEEQAPVNDDVDQFTNMTTEHPHGTDTTTPHHHHPTTHDPGHGGGGHSMKMYFHVGAHATILFEQWHTMTAGEIAGSAVVLGVIAALYEGLKVLRLFLGARADSLHRVEDVKTGGTRRIGLASGWHILQSLLHLVQVFVGYCLMLAFMTFNAWLCLGLVVGFALGYYFFAWMKPARSDDSQGDCCN